MTKGFVYEPNTQTVTVGFFLGDGSMSGGEITLTWKSILGVGRVTDAIKLEIYDDAAKALIAMPEILEKVAESEKNHITIEEFVGFLKSVGYEDISR